mgnify:FL=1
MNEVNRARWKLLGGIFIVIILIHVIAVSCIVASHHPVDSAAAASSEESSREVASKEPEKAPEEEKKSGGFWSWLFGGGGEEESASAAQSGGSRQAAAQKRDWRYKKPSTDPQFGTPFHFEYAKRGDFSAREIPGSSGAKSGIMIDLSTRNVLWEKNSTKPVPIASMVKMMTLYTAFEELEENPKFSLDSPVKISPEVLKVPRTGIIWLDPRETFPLSDLMKAATIKSANDAAVQIAMFLGDGSQEAFVAKMNAKALELGMANSNFVSACGLPDRKKGNSVSTAQDLMILAEHLLQYPQYLEWSSTRLDYIREGKKRTMLNTTNRLVNARYPGVDGLKTGYTDDAGYCLTFSVLRNGRRIIGCVTGFDSASKGRDSFCQKLIEWGYKRAAELEQKK